MSSAVRVAALGFSFWLAWPQVQERLGASPDKASVEASEDDAWREAWDRAPRRWQVAIATWIRPEIRYRMTAIAGCESNFLVSARCLDCLGVREDSWGGWQHNRLVWAHLWDVYDMNTIEGQAQAAQHVYDIQGFDAWRNCAERLGIL